MIEIRNLSKSFDEIRAVSDVSLNIREHEVFGLVGTNGAGKSTLLRMIADTLVPDQGEVFIDGKPVHDDPLVKRKVFFIADDAYYFPNSIPREMAEYYAKIYKNFDMGRFTYLLNHFHLDPSRMIDTYSKGMKKQLSIILGISSGTRYLLCDETFDGLDPVIRQGVKSLFARDMADRGLTPIIASHNLRELEDICDHVGLLHEGGVLLSEDLSDMQERVQKVQAVFKTERDRIALEDRLSIRYQNSVGRLNSYIINASREEAEEIFSSAETVYYEILKLTLEEIFISTTEVAGYDVRKFILA